MSQLGAALSLTYSERVTMVYDRDERQDPLFSAAECDDLIACTIIEKTIVRDEIFNLPEQPGLGTLSRRHEQFRFSRFTNNEKIRLFRQKLESIVNEVNRQVWCFDIHGLSDYLLINKYNVGHKVTLHWDLVPEQANVKLVVIVQLSPGNAYQGGRLEFGFGPPIAASQQQGGVAIFPSWVVHRVTPVTAGTRYTAVCHVVGPSFR